MEERLQEVVVVVDEGLGAEGGGQSGGEGGARAK